MGFNRNKGVDSYITKVLLQTKLYQRHPRKFRRVSVKVGVSRFECLTPVFWKLSIWVKGLLLLGFYKDCRDHNWIILGAMKHGYLVTNCMRIFANNIGDHGAATLQKIQIVFVKIIFFLMFFSELRLWSLPNEISVINGVVEALQLPIVSKLNTFDWCFLWKYFKVDF